MSTKSNSALGIHKEILRQEYAKTEVGKAEAKLKEFYGNLKKKGEALPEEIAEQVYNIREANEQAQLEYIKQSEKENREKVDQILLDSFNKEIAILENYALQQSKSN